MPDLLTNVRWGLDGVKELVNLHPLFTHFPVALLLSSLGFYLLGLVFKKEHFLKTGQWTLYFGTLGAAAAVGTSEYLWPALTALMPSVFPAELSGVWLVICKKGSVQLKDAKSGRLISCRFEKNTITDTLVSKGAFKHFMLKEIHDSPSVINRIMKINVTHRNYFIF